MTHPHNIEFSGDTAQYQKRKIAFYLTRRNGDIDGEGILNISDKGAISGKYRVQIEHRNFDAGRAQVDVIYLEQAEFDQIQFPDDPESPLALSTNR